MDLKGIKVAVIISDGFEQSEFIAPVEELRKAGATVEVLAQSKEQMKDGIQGLNHMEKGITVKPDCLVQDCSPNNYHGLLIPGGAISADHMRESHQHLAFVRNFFDLDKPVACICHGGWVLADAGVLQGVTMTSWPAIRKDLERAGAVWKDQQVVIDRNLVTSRKPDDVPVFIRTFMDQLLGLEHREKSEKAA